MRYEKIKEAVASGVHTQIMEHRGDGAAEMAAIFDSIAERRPFRVSLQELADKCYNVIMQWDVRCVGQLRELFPLYFPPSLRKGELVAEYDDECNWIVNRRT